jgi:hypothetical protein
MDGSDACLVHVKALDWPAAEDAGQAEKAVVKAHGRLRWASITTQTNSASVSTSPISGQTTLHMPMPCS